MKWCYFLLHVEINIHYIHSKSNGTTDGDSKANKTKQNKTKNNNKKIANRVKLKTITRNCYTEDVRVGDGSKKQMTDLEQWRTEKDFSRAYMALKYVSKRGYRNRTDTEVNITTVYLKPDIWNTYIRHLNTHCRQRAKWLSTIAGTSYLVWLEINKVILHVLFDLMKINGIIFIRSKRTCKMTLFISNNSR